MYNYNCYCLYGSFFVCLLLFFFVGVGGALLSEFYDMGVRSLSPGKKNHAVLLKQSSGGFRPSAYRLKRV